MIVLDEPLASLDPLARRQFMETMLGVVTERGTTVFLSSHIISELEPVCDHMVIMSGGRVRIAGSVESLLVGAPRGRHPLRRRTLPSTLETVSVWGAQRQIHVAGPR